MTIEAARPRLAQGASAQILPLTSLRFFAAYAVLLYHVPYVMPGAFSAPIFPYGNLGVGFFFVLSGFILAHTYTSHGALRLRTFYVKRLARIYPLHLATFAVWCLLFYRGWGCPPSDKINSAIPNLLLLQAFFTTHLFILGFNPVSWSLSAEAFFYLVFPIVRNPQRAAAWCALWACFAVIAVLSGVAQRLEALSGSFFYFNPLARLFDFCLGILCCFCANRFPRNLLRPSLVEAVSLVIMICVVAGVSMLPEALRHPITAAAFGQFIIVMATSRGAIGSLLSLPLLVLLGEASYSLYLLHHMLLRLIAAALGAVATGLPALLIGSGIAAAVSVVCYLTFERWSRKTVVDALLSSQQQNDLVVPLVDGRAMAAHNRPYTA